MSGQYENMPALRNGDERGESINLGEWLGDIMPSEIRRLMDMSIDAVDSTLLSLSEKLVLREILWMDRTEDRGCWHSAETTAKRKGLSVRTVHRCRQTLIKKGLLRMEPGTPTPSQFIRWPWYEYPEPSGTEHKWEIALRWAGYLSQYLASASGLPGADQLSGPSIVGSTPVLRSVSVVSPPPDRMSAPPDRMSAQVGQDVRPGGTSCQPSTGISTGARTRKENATVRPSRLDSSLLPERRIPESKEGNPEGHAATAESVPFQVLEEPAVPMGSAWQVARRGTNGQNTSTVNFAPSVRMISAQMVLTQPRKKRRQKRVVLTQETKDWIEFLKLLHAGRDSTTKVKP